MQEICSSQIYRLIWYFINKFNKFKYLREQFDRTEDSDVKFSMSLVLLKEKVAQRVLSEYY